MPKNINTPCRCCGNMFIKKREAHNFCSKNCSMKFAVSVKVIASQFELFKSPPKVDKKTQQKIYRGRHIQKVGLIAFRKKQQEYNKKTRARLALAKINQLTVHLAKLQENPSC